jgi:hypothetical protein
MLATVALTTVKTSRTLSPWLRMHSIRHEWDKVALTVSHVSMLACACGGSDSDG